MHAQPVVQGDVEPSQGLLADDVLGDRCKQPHGGDDDDEPDGEVQAEVLPPGESGDQELPGPGITRLEPPLPIDYPCDDRRAMGDEPPRECGCRRDAREEEKNAKWRVS